MKSQAFLRGVLLIVVSVVLSYTEITRAQEPGQKETSLFQAAEDDWHNQRWESAVAKYKQLVAQFPASPLAADAHFQIGYYLSYVASPEEAIAEYEQTIALAPGSHDAHEAKIGIAALKYWQQDYEGAYELFRQVITETNDWALIKECTFRMKEIGRVIELQKLPARQTGMMDCGPKALAIALKKYGISASDDEMLKMIKVSRQGATLEQLKDAARLKGLMAWAVRLKTEQLPQIRKPFIAHIRPGHYVVVTGTAPGRVDYADPHRGETYRTKDRFERLWQGYALIFTKEIPRGLRPQLLTDTEMQSIYGGHHLHGMNLGGSTGNPASKFHDDPANSRCGPGLPSVSVNLSNYNLLVQDTDFSYGGRGPGVELTRTYNADSTSESAFGRSWTFNYDVFLVVSPNGSVDIKRDDGKVDNFVPSRLLKNSVFWSFYHVQVFRSIL